MSIGTFSVIYKARPWIGAHILSVLPHVDQMSLYDNQSTDGADAVVEAIQRCHPEGHKIKLVKGRTYRNLTDGWADFFNECMWALDTEWAWYYQPDMFCINPEKIADFKDMPGQHATSGMITVAGDDVDGELFEIFPRERRWDNIGRLRNPDLGAHYYGTYADKEEGIFYRDITGKSHRSQFKEPEEYPYPVLDSGIECIHYSDVRPRAERWDRIYKTALYDGREDAFAHKVADIHARVTLNPTHGHNFKPIRESEAWAGHCRFMVLRAQAEAMLEGSVKAGHRS